MRRAASEAQANAVGYQVFNARHGQLFGVAIFFNRNKSVALTISNASITHQVFLAITKYKITPTIGTTIDNTANTVFNTS
jgi:hypothetical protein